MDKETFRKYVINLLKKSKIYYIDFDGGINELRKTKDIEEEVREQRDFLYKLRYLNSIGYITSNSMTVYDSTNYNILINEQIDKINYLQNQNNLNIEDDYTLEDIAEVISGICDNIDYKEFNDSTILSRFKKEKAKGLKYENKFIKEFSTK